MEIMVLKENEYIESWESTIVVILWCNEDAEKYENENAGRSSACGEK